MPANARTWGLVIAVVAIVLIVISLTFLSRQIENAPVPTPTGNIPTVTAEINNTAEATAESQE